MGAVGETKLEGTQTRAAPSLESFGRYRVVGPLSKGGMAELSLAMQLGVQGFSRVVALKRVLATHAERPEFLQMFLDEARLAARLNHPNIVRIYELGQDGEAYFLAMEYLAGEDLRQLHDLVAASGGRVSCELAAHLVARAADALHFAHELTDEQGAPLNLVHRDVSPSNLIVTYDGHLKVVDFGIAKARTNAFETGLGIMKGKLGYFAPEQLAGAPVDRRCDVFGLGIVLWELLTNVRLFMRDSAAATMAAASLGEVPPLSGFRDDVSGDLAAIVECALAHDPAHRFQTAGEMRDALEHYLRVDAVEPTARDVAEWIVGLGGTRRAELKLAIARGSNVVASYEELSRLPWGGLPTAHPVPSSASRRRARPAWQVLGFAAGAGALVALGGVIGATSFRDEAPAQQRVRGAVMLESVPPGAVVFIGGEPSGAVTPTTLTGLDPSKPLSFRLELPGYSSVVGEVRVEGGATVTRRETLVAVDGIVRFVGLPSGGAVRVDGKVVMEGEAVTLRPGRHVAELLVGGKVVASPRIAVAPGPQEVPIAP